MTRGSLPGRRGPSRRTALRALAVGAGTLALGGCDVRLESAIAPTPTRAPAPDEAVLLGLLVELAELARTAAAVAPVTATTTRVASQHLAQLAVVRDRLRTAGVPDAALNAATSTATARAASTSGSTTPRSVAVGALATLEAAAVSAAHLSALTTTTAADRLLLTSITVARAATAVELGASPTWPRVTLPSAVASDLLDATRSVVYAFEVVAAHLPAEGRTAALATRAVMAGRAASLRAVAGQGHPDPLGYDLPFEVTSATQATRLAAYALTGLVASGLGCLAGAAPRLPVGSAAVATVARLQTEAVTTARGWGVTPSAFPGLRTG